MAFGGFFALLSSIMFFTSYMESDQSYPHPLSPEEEGELILKAQDGDKSARDKLVNHNMRLVVHIAKKYTNYPDIEELISVGSIGLIKGINSYKSGKNSTLATYCARCIENEMLMTIRANKKHKSTRSLYDPIGTDKDGNELCVMDLLCNEEDDVSDKIEKDIVSEKLLEILKTNLSDREYEILKYRYGLENAQTLPQREIADMFDISRSYVSRIEKKALDQVRQAVLDAGLYEL